MSGALRFNYRAYGESGVETSGEISADTEIEALERLNGQGLSVFDLQKKSISKGPWWRREVSLFGDAQPDPRAQMLFFEAFALLANAGLSIPAALRAAAQVNPSDRLIAAVASISDAIDAGSTLSSQARDHPTVFAPNLISLLEIGEAANRLALSAEQAVRILKSEIGFREALRNAITYPIVLLVASVFVVLGLIFFLAPSLEPVFAAVAAEPPVLISALLVANDKLATYWLPIILAIAAICAAFVSAWRRRKPRILGALLRAPIIGRFLRDQETARAFSTISLMMQSGASLPIALLSAARTARTAPFAMLLEVTEEAVQAGREMSTLIEESELAPKDAVLLIRLGEKSNQLPLMLKNASEMLGNRVEQTSQRVLSMLTPVLTILIGGLVGGLIVTTISAILEINELAY